MEKPWPFSQFFHCKNKRFFRPFTSSANPDSIRRIHCQIRTKKLFVQKERFQLNRVQNKSNFTRKLANFYLSNVASIQFSTFKNVVLDENIVKIGKSSKNFSSPRFKIKSILLENYATFTYAMLIPFDSASSNTYI